MRTVMSVVMGGTRYPDKMRTAGTAVPEDTMAPAVGSTE